MKPRKHQVRRLELPSAIVDFDEQLWPVNLVLVIIAGCLAGLVIATGDFQTTNLLHSAYVHLAVLILLMAALFWGVHKLSRRGQRRLQLGILLSLLAHLWICMWTYSYYVEFLAARDRNESLQAEDDEPLVTLPDYHWQQPEEQATPTLAENQLDDPVPTETLETEQTQVARAEAGDVPVEREQVDEQAAASEIMPSPVQIERADPAAVQRSESPGRLSRQELASASPTESIAELPTPVAASDSPDAPESVAELQRQANSEAPELTRPQPTQPTQQSDALAEARPLQRQSAETALPEIQSQMEIVRQSAAAQVAVESPQASPQPAAAAEPAAPAMSPAAAALARAEAAAPSVQAQPSSAAAAADAMAEPSPAAPVEVALSTPEIAAAQPAELQRQSSTVEIELSAAPLPAASAAPAGPERSTAEAALPSLSRAESGAVSAASPGPASIEPGAAAADVARAEMSAAQSAASEAPQIAAVAAPAPLERSSPGAAVSGEAVAEDSAAPVGAANSESVSQQPVSTAVARAEGGVSGLTQQQNFDEALPGAAVEVVAGGAAARRPQATQSDAAGPQVAPSAPAQLARSRAGAEFPAASLPAADVEFADASGSQSPADVEASSSAAVARAAAAAPAGRVTADAGSSSVDLGAAAIVSRIGAERASGGGEPSVASAGTPQLARAEIGAEPGGQMAAAVPLDVPAAAGGASGSESLADEPAPVAGQLVAQRGGGVPISEASAGAGAGPSGADVAGGVVSQGPAAQQARSEAPQVAALGASGQIARASAQPGALDLDVDSADLAMEAAAASESGVPGDAGSGLEAASVAQAPQRLPGSVPGAAQPVSEGGSPAETGSEIGPTAELALASRPAPSAGVADGPVVEAGGAGSLTAPSRSNGAAMPREAGPSEGEEIELASVEGPIAFDPGEPAQAASGGPQRQAGSGLPVQVASIDGPGGLSDADIALDAGLPQRLARPEAQIVAPVPGRLILERSGGLLAVDARVRDTSVPGFRQRDIEMRGDAARRAGGTAGTERAVEAGLDFLARYQAPEGCWRLHDFANGDPEFANAGLGQMQSDTAGAGLALLAFLGAGYTHTDGKYRDTVRRALDFLVSRQKPDGDLFVGGSKYCWLYSHGIASIALCEAYGMTRDPALRDPAQRAIDFIVAAQNKEEGGWRYSPGRGSDTSVSGWQMMALKSAELAGLNVSSEPYTLLSSWLDHAEDDGRPYLYVYRPEAEQAHQRQASQAMTAESLLMRQYLGWTRDVPELRAGADYLLEHLPQFGSRAKPQRDAYYWYYATQVMFQMQGPHWEQWNERLREMLVDSQAQDGPLRGSWDPLAPVPDRWGQAGGRIYVTAMQLLMLEVYYRHLPLYQNLE